MKPAFDLWLWGSRLFIGTVTAWNLQAAWIFFSAPQRFAPAFELSGVPGETAVRGMAVLFAMWNVPYLVALWNPRRHRLSLWEAQAMQILGVLGESYIYFTLPAAHALLQTSILRFVVFDAAGAILLAMALVISNKPISKPLA
ncbi:MAG: hypothetical protein ACUVRJ_00270 [Candidatus Villigracilaceae bacterium]